VVLTWHLLRSSKVVCPRCSTVYAQSKFQLQCPSCGLKILQEDP
jgi:ribosomal protein S27E